MANLVYRTTVASVATSKKFAVQTRTSVFEENVFNFVKNHKLAADDPIPAGFRASWQERGKLAVSKTSQLHREGYGQKRVH